MKIIFVQDAVYQKYGITHPDNPTFAKGDIKEMSDDAAQHWITRKKAEPYDAAKHAPKPPPKVEAAQTGDGKGEQTGAGAGQTGDGKGDGKGKGKP